MNNIKNVAEVSIEWNNCSFDTTNLPNESGMYLVICFKEFEILPFFKKGEVVFENNIGKTGMKNQMIVTESGFYRDNKESLYEKAIVCAWAKLPDNVEEILNKFTMR